MRPEARGTDAGAKRYRAGHGGDCEVSEASAPALDRSTQLAEERTSLAVERSFLAFERTLMAWLRTSLSLISFGFTLAKFFQYLAQQRAEPVVGLLGRTWASDTVGLTMITIGTAALVLAVIQHRRRVNALRAHGLVRQWNLALWIAAPIAVLGVFAFVSLLFEA
jgi:putative membrane protein